MILGKSSFFVQIFWKIKEGKHNTFEINTLYILLPFLRDVHKLFIAAGKREVRRHFAQKGERISVKILSNIMKRNCLTQLCISMTGG